MFKWRVQFINFYSCCEFSNLLKPKNEPAGVPATDDVISDIFLSLLDFSSVRTGFAIQDMGVGWGCA
jgi:hypothetical protein